jgi:hypothetical protein
LTLWPAVLIERNELRYFPTTWDIRLEGRTLAVREAQGRYLTEIVFDPPSKVTVLRGRFSFNGIEFEVRPDLLIYANSLVTWSRVSFNDFPVAIALGRGSLSKQAAMTNSAPRRGRVDRRALEDFIRDFRRRDREIKAALFGRPDCT